MRPIVIAFGAENRMETESIPTAITDIRSLLRHLTLKDAEKGGKIRVDISIAFEHEDDDGDGPGSDDA